MNRFLAAATSLFLVLACNDPDPLRPVAAPRAVLATDIAGITVLTWNVYVGAEVERILQAQTPDEAVAIATEQWARVRATNFPARAGLIAAGIAAAGPQLVGLDEVALYRVTDRPFEELATQVAYDFLQLVIDSLHARGLEYGVGAVDRTTDIQVPVIAGFDAAGQPILAGVRFTDGDAVLVQAGVPYANPRSAAYDAHQTVTLGGVTTGVYQGWSSVDATLAGTTYRVVATHLAGQEAQVIQLGQTRELIALLEREARPTILVGDFNSDAYGADPSRATPTYGMLRATGFGDSWIDPDRNAPGLTCCEQPDLRNPRPTLDQRIDFVFARHFPERSLVVRRQVLGDRQSDRTAGLWPSDHAAVVATFLTPPVR